MSQLSHSPEKCWVDDGISSRHNLLTPSPNVVVTGATVTLTCSRNWAFDNSGTQTKTVGILSCSLVINHKAKCNSNPKNKINKTSFIVLIISRNLFISIDPNYPFNSLRTLQMKSGKWIKQLVPRLNAVRRYQRAQCGTVKTPAPPDTNVTPANVSSVVLGVTASSTAMITAMRQSVRLRVRLNHLLLS